MRRYIPWTEDDVAKLRQAKADGLTYEETAARIGRTEFAVAEKARKLRLATKDNPWGIVKRHDPNEWPEEKAQRLKVLWEQGWSASMIADDVGYSKNAVVGKAHRLHLEPRPSPIQFGHEKKPRVYKPRPRRLRTEGGHTGPTVLKGPTLPPPVSLQAAKPINPPSPPTRTPEMSTPVLPFRDTKKIRKCTYIAEDDTGPWREQEPKWCNKPVKAGSNFSYCEEHHALCFRPTPRQTAAA